MAYITQDDLVVRLSQDYLLGLTDDDNDGVPDQEVIDKAIEQAGSEIDAYVGTRYDVPLSDPPEVIKKLCVDLTIYYLHMRKENMTDSVQRMYDNAIKLLLLIAKGSVSIGAGDTVEQPSGSSIMVKTKEKMFDLDEMP